MLSDHCHLRGDYCLRGQSKVWVYLERQSEGNSSLEMAGSPSCPPLDRSVAGFHRPGRRVWNGEASTLVPEGPPRGVRTAAVPRRQFLLSSVKAAPIRVPTHWCGESVSGYAKNLCLVSGILVVSEACLLGVPALDTYPVHEPCSWFFVCFSHWAEDWNSKPHTCLMNTRPLNSYPRP